VSEQAMVELAKSVVRDPGYQKHLESLPDERLGSSASSRRRSARSATASSTASCAWG
jgi:hypothetical protein